MAVRKNKKKNFFHLSVMLALIILVAAVSFLIGTKFEASKSKTTMTAEAAKGGIRYGSDITNSYAQCEGFKTNSTDTVPPVISIIKPTDGEKIAGIKGDGIVWVTMKATDGQGPAFPNLYVNGQIGLATINLINSPDYPGAMTGYIHVQPNQTYTLTAKACDRGGNEAWSSPVVITISNK